MFLTQPSPPEIVFPRQPAPGQTSCPHPALAGSRMSAAGFRPASFSVGHLAGRKTQRRRRGIFVASSVKQNIKLRRSGIFRCRSYGAGDGIESVSTKMPRLRRYPKPIRLCVKIKPFARSPASGFATLSQNLVAQSSRLRVAAASRRPPAGSRENGLNHLPHPGLLPKEKEKRAPAF